MGIHTLMFVLTEFLFPLLQPNPGGGGQQVPITEGILLLLAAALGYGIKIFSGKKRK